MCWCAECISKVNAWTSVSYNPEILKLLGPGCMDDALQHALLTNDTQYVDTRFDSRNPPSYPMLE